MCRLITLITTLEEHLQLFRMKHELIHYTGMVWLTDFIRQITARCN